MMLNAMTVSTTASPGKSDIHNIPDVARAVGDDVSPARGGRVNAHTEKRESGLENDDVADAERGGNDDRRGDPREDVAPENSSMPSPQGASGDHHLLGLELEHLRAYEAARREPSGESQNEHERPQGHPSPQGEDRKEHEDSRDRRQRVY